MQNGSINFNVEWKTCQQLYVSLISHYEEAGDWAMMKSVDGSFDAEQPPKCGVWVENGFVRPIKSHIWLGFATLKP